MATGLQYVETSYCMDNDLIDGSEILRDAGRGPVVRFYLIDSIDTVYLFSI